jgi:hypothetical protein
VAPQAERPRGRAREPSPLWRITHSIVLDTRVRARRPSQKRAPTEMARQDFARYSYCLPASSEQPPPGRLQCKRRIACSPGGAHQQVGAWWPLVQFLLAWHALCLCQCARLPAAACMHDAHTAAASASASITSVSAHTHWALGAEPMPPSSSRARTCMPDRRRQAPRPLACCCCAVPLPCCSQWRGPHGLAHRYPLQLCHRPRLVFSTCLRKSNR